MKKCTKDKIELNCQNMEKIDEKYDELLSNIAIYIRVALNTEDAEEVINDILEILLGAQARGEDLHKVIGEDYKTFCDEIIRSYKSENKFYFLSNFKEIALMTLATLPFFLALNCFSQIGDFGMSLQNLWSADYNIGIIPILGNLIAIPVVYSILGYIAKNPGISHKKDFIFFFMIHLVYIGFLVFVGYQFRSIVLLTIPNYFICFSLSLVLLIGYFSYFRKLAKD